MMTIPVGTISIYLVLGILVLVMFFLTKSASGNQFSLVTGRQLYYLSTIVVFFSLVMLLAAFLFDQFQFAYVYENSSKDMPNIYKIAAVWAGKEGSFLLWVFMLNIFGVMIIRSNEKYENILMMVIAVTQIFLLLLLAVESPFRYIWEVMPESFNRVAAIPAGFDGMGMNPLLLDPWMVAHPPVLFLGYASATIPFGYAVAALLKKDYTSWLKNSYRWLLFSMSTLGIGIFLGGYWAYKVLGWGGYWGWDPVENSSLIPWLVAVALMHSMLIQRRTGSLVRSNIFMSLFYFILVFYSTFLTRSGVLSNFSVHSFGGGGASGYIIFFILFFLIVAAFLFISNFKKIEAPGLGEDVVSWQGMTVYGVITVFIYGMVVLVGTSMPILTSFFTAQPVPVTAHFYNNISVPLGLIIISLMVSATMLSGRGTLKKIPVIIFAVLAAAVGIITNIIIADFLVPMIFTAAGIFILGVNMYDLARLNAKAILPSRLAHIGVGVMILGIMTSGYHSSTVQKKIIQGKEEKVGPVTLTFTGISDDAKSRASFKLGAGEGAKNISMEYYISKRANNTLYREPYIKMGIFGDIYIIPEQYKEGIAGVAFARLKKGEEVTMGDLKVTLAGIRSANMMSKQPAIHADIIINGKKVSPGVRFHDRHRHPIEVMLPGTKRKVKLQGFDVRNKTVDLYIEPGKNTPVPPDTMLVNVSEKRMIWLVWLGTLLIAAGGLLAMVRTKRSTT